MKEKLLSIVFRRCGQGLDLQIDKSGYWAVLDSGRGYGIAWFLGETAAVAFSDVCNRMVYRYYDI